MFSFIYTWFFSCIYAKAHFDRRRNASFGLAWLCSYLTSEGNMSRVRSGKRARKYRHWLHSHLGAAHRPSAVCQSDWHRSYAHLVTRFMTHLAIALCEGKSSSNKIQYPPGGAIRSGTVPEGRAIRESACVLSTEFLTSRRKFFRNWGAPPVLHAVRWTFREKRRARKNRLRRYELLVLLRTEITY